MGIDRELKYLSIDNKNSILIKVELILSGLWRQCNGHALNLVAKEIRGHFSKVHTFVSNGKKI